MSRRLLFLAALALVPLGVQPSRATFVASATSGASSFATAADFNTVAVALADPGSPLQGSVALSASASSDRGIARVRFQVAPTGTGTWTDACEATAAPYTCAWDTAGDDGLLDVRAVARDIAGYERTAVRTVHRVDNLAPSVALANPGASLRGGVTLTVTAADAGVGVAASGIVLEYRPTGGTWIEICRRSAGGTCVWATGALPDGDYDLRASAVDTLGHAATTAVLPARHVDNSVPTATVTTPPPPVAHGTVTVAVTPSDTGGSGIQKVVFEARPVNTTDWYPICERTAAPYSCTADSAGYAPDGDYQLRAVTYDNSGNTFTSAIMPIKIDNTQPTGAMVTPVPTLSGTATLTATAADGGAGVASVRFERVTANQGGWSALCTDTAAPYTCDWAVPAGDQLWDLRAVITDHAGNVRPSVVVEDRPGGTRPAGQDVQGANGGVAGLLDAGDTFMFTFTEPVTALSLLAGWNGAATPVTIRVADGGTRDTLTVRTADDAAPAALAAELQLDRDVTAAGATLAGSLARSGATVTLAVGALGSGALTPAPGAGTLVWTPAAAALDAIGLPALTTPVTESGAGDEDL